MLSANRRLRPMGISDILDETIELYKSSFVLLIGIAAAAYVPYFLVSALLPQPQPVKNPEEALVALTSWMPQIILSIILALILEPIVTGALTYAISEKYLSRSTTIKECFSQVLRWRTFRSLVGATVVRYLFMLLPVILMTVVAAFAMFAVASGARGSATEIVLALGLFALGVVMLIPMAYFALRFLVVAPAVVVEERGVIGALQRSWSLMRGSILKAFGVVLIAFIIVLIVVGIITGPTTVIIAMKNAQGQQPSSFVIVLNMILSAVVNTLTVPILSIVSILLYYDIRIRKEGFDLQILADELDRKTHEMNTRDISSLPQERLSPEQTDEDPIADKQA